MVQLPTQSTTPALVANHADPLEALASRRFVLVVVVVGYLLHIITAH